MLTTIFANVHAQLKANFADFQIETLTFLAQMHAINWLLMLGKICQMNGIVLK